MQIAYVGPYDEVEVPELGLVVPKNTPILVDDEVGKNMCKQDGVWSESKSAGKPRRTADKPVEETS
jgi:hypothetical protein